MLRRRAHGFRLSKFHAQRNRSEGVMADLLVELAGSPDAHHGKPHTMPGNNPLTADANGCLSDPGPSTDVMAVPKQIPVEREVPSDSFGLQVQECMCSGFGGAR